MECMCPVECVERVVYRPETEGLRPSPICDTNDTFDNTCGWPGVFGSQWPKCGEQCEA